jgi:hypothetical protein
MQEVMDWIEKEVEWLDREMKGELAEAQKKAQSFR